MPASNFQSLCKLCLQRCLQPYILQLWNCLPNQILTWLGWCWQSSGPLPKGKLSKHFKQGVLFITYSLLVSGARSWAGKAVQNADGVEVEAPVDKSSRLAQILDWLGEEGNGEPLIVLDECHKAKNLLTSKGVQPRPRVCLRV